MEKPRSVTFLTAHVLAIGTKFAINILKDEFSMCLQIPYMGLPEDYAMRKDESHTKFGNLPCNSEDEEDINFVVCQRFEKQRRLNTYTFGQIEPILLRHRELGHFDLAKAQAFIEKRKEREEQILLEEQAKACKPKGLLQLMKMLLFRDKEHIS